MTKTKIALITIATIVLLGGAAYTYIATTNSSQDRTPSSTSNQDKESPERENDSPDSKPKTTDSDKSYVETPISNPPEINDPYPIENEHYKIDQNSSTSYHITLYPIANNPRYSNYDAQLKAYKIEALDYLEKRYQSIDNFKIKWTPSDAEEV